MFKILNGTGGTLAISLERGSITLQPGKSFDLDGICSRKWIKNNPALQYLLTAKLVVVLHDSEQGIPKSAVKAPRQVRTVPVMPVPETPPVIIDFSKVPDVDAELPIEELVKHAEVENVETTEVVKEEPQIVVERLPELERMKKEELIDWALQHNIILNPDLSKRELKNALRSSNIYKALIGE